MSETKAEARARAIEAKAASVAAYQARKAQDRIDQDRRRAEAVAARELRIAEASATRSARFHAGHDWRHGAISTREYADYGAYLDHQREKLDGIKASLETRFDDMTAGFRRRFELLDLPAPASVLCLGARLGQEVAAFISLGHFAVGIDLNPGDDNRYVVTGDFHRLQFADQSVDAVYINSVDHIFDVAAIIAEVCRVLKPDGLFVADIVAGHEEGFVAGEFEAIHWAKASDMVARIEAEGLRLERMTNLADVGAPLWNQAVFRQR